MTGMTHFNIEYQEVCRGCSLGKYTKSVFPSSDSRSAGVLYLIHTYVCGPMSCVSLGGREYYVTFIDYHSSKISIYFLKTKSEVFKRFCNILSILHSLLFNNML
jgi:hypothetical protein